MMQCMSEDDAAYTELLTQLLSDSSSTRNARVHSWIEHQYDFAFSEQDHAVSHSRSPSPSPSSSLGAHRTFSVDRPDSPLLPRSSADSPSSPRPDACPSYDTLFFPQSPRRSEEDQREERERERALKFIIQEMAVHLKIQSTPSTPGKHTDKVRFHLFFSLSSFMPTHVSSRCLHPLHLQRHPSPIRCPHWHSVPGHPPCESRVCRPSRVLFLLTRLVHKTCSCLPFPCPSSSMASHNTTWFSVANRHVPMGILPQKRTSIRTRNKMFASSPHKMIRTPCFPLQLCLIFHVRSLARHRSRLRMRVSPRHQPALPLALAASQKTLESQRLQISNNHSRNPLRLPLKGMSLFTVSRPRKKRFLAHLLPLWHRHLRQPLLSNHLPRTSPCLAVCRFPPFVVYVRLTRADRMCSGGRSSRTINATSCNDVRYPIGIALVHRYHRVIRGHETKLVPESADAAER
ncbi:hypothetical protein EDC04DRAFT_931550 [Pisolithus marmoratus]|nr:hypothetical protein EDC04DRAFT_931550 [Pisolithus marmoratus]